MPAVHSVWSYRTTPKQSKVRTVGFGHQRWKDESFFAIYHVNHSFYSNLSSFLTVRPVLSGATASAQVIHEKLGHCERIQGAGITEEPFLTVLTESYIICCKSVHHCPTTMDLSYTSLWSYPEHIQLKKHPKKWPQTVFPNLKYYIFTLSHLKLVCRTFLNVSGVITLIFPLWFSLFQTPLTCRSVQL